MGTDLDDGSASIGRKISQPQKALPIQEIADEKRANEKSDVLHFSSTQRIPGECRLPLLYASYSPSAGVADISIA